MPEFFRNGREMFDGIVHDPDLFTRPIAPPQLHDVEALNHYFDLEPLAGEKLPLTRYEFLEIVYRKKLQPSKVGLLPYAVVECTQRLSVVFAECRQHPNDKVIQAKCLVYAAELAHYAQDLCQPLHATIDYDGRAKADGSSPHSGIHAKIDRLMGQLTEAPTQLPAELKPYALTTPLKDTSNPTTQPKTREEVQAHRKAETARAHELMDAVMAELHRSHDLVDKVYAMEKDLPADWKTPLPPNVEAFARERLQRAAQFTANLFLTAWQDSEYIEFPQWHRDGE
jgi:hypothetical protein